MNAANNAKILLFNINTPLLFHVELSSFLLFCVKQFVLPICFTWNSSFLSFSLFHVEHFVLFVFGVVRLYNCRLLLCAECDDLKGLRSAYLYIK